MISLRLILKSFPDLIIRTNNQGRNYNKLTMLEEPTLYGDIASPPVRFVMITASFLGVKLRFRKIDLFKSENKTDFYRQINPLQKVPALAIGDKVICDSHAIALYLCEKSENPILYPKNDIITKARVDEMLFYNATTLFPVDSTIFTDFFAGKWPSVETNVTKWYEALHHLEHRLTVFEWLSGDKMYLSDICCAMTVSSLSLLIPVPERFQNVTNWMQRLEDISFIKKINTQGLERLRVFIKRTSE